MQRRLQSHGFHRPGEYPVGPSASPLLAADEPPFECRRVGEQSLVAVAQRRDACFDDTGELPLDFVVADPAPG